MLNQGIINAFALMCVIKNSAVLPIYFMPSSSAPLPELPNYDKY